MYPWILVLLSTFASMFGSHGPSNTQTVDISSWNVCAEHCPNLPPWTERAPQVVDALVVGRPVVVAIQEAGRRDVEVAVLDDLLRGEGYTQVAGAHARYIYVDLDRADVHTTGIVTARRTASSKSTNIPWATLDVGGDMFTVASVHLTSSDGLPQDLDRLYEVQSLVAAVPEGPAVFLGDFNSLTRHDDPDLDADSERWRVHGWLTTHGWVSTAPDTSTYLQQAGDTRRLGVLNFDRLYARGFQSVTSKAGSSSLSDHVPVEFHASLATAAS